MKIGDRVKIKDKIDINTNCNNSPGWGYWNE